MLDRLMSFACDADGNAIIDEFVVDEINKCGEALETLFEHIELAEINVSMDTSD